MLALLALILRPRLTELRDEALPVLHMRGTVKRGGAAMGLWSN